MEENEQTNLIDGFTAKQKDEAEAQISLRQKETDFDIREYPVEVIVKKFTDKIEGDKAEIFVPEVKAREYGFQLADHDKAASRDGVRLLNVKAKRNELAHGSISFEDCGQDTSVDELVAIFDEIKLFIKAVLDGVSEYLSTSSYLRAVNANTAKG